MLNNRKSLAKFMEPIGTLGVKNMFKNILVMLLVIIGSNHAWAESKTTFYHYDLLGSPVATTDQAGNVLWREEYSPWGEKLLKQDSSHDNVRDYTGHVHDKETGLTYMQARYYDPQIGRFMGVDPVGFKEGNTISFNRYGYANNNPFKFTDPNGEEGFDGFDSDEFQDALNDGDISGFDLSESELEDFGNGMKDLAVDTAIFAVTTAVTKNPTAGRAAIAMKAAGVAQSGKAGNYVYRGLSKSDNIKYGIKARSPNAGNSEISHVAGKKNTQWISTTKDKNIAINKYGKNGVARINLDKVNAHVSDISKGFPNGGRMTNWAKTDKEVLIKNSIPSNAIKRIK